MSWVFLGAAAVSAVVLFTLAVALGTAAKQADESSDDVWRDEQDRMRSERRGW